MGNLQAPTVCSTFKPGAAPRENPQRSGLAVEDRRIHARLPGLLCPPVLPAATDVQQIRGLRVSKIKRSIRVTVFGLGIVSAVMSAFRASGIIVADTLQQIARTVAAYAEADILTLGTPKVYSSHQIQRFGNKHVGRPTHWSGYEHRGCDA